jgi:hypothetical protein
VYCAVFLRNFISAAVILDLSCSFNIHASLPYSRVGIARMLYIRSLVCFWTMEGFRTRLTIPVIFRNFDNLFVTYFQAAYNSIKEILCSYGTQGHHKSPSYPEPIPVHIPTICFFLPSILILFSCLRLYHSCLSLLVSFSNQMFYAHLASPVFYTFHYNHSNSGFILYI